MKRIFTAMLVCGMFFSLMCVARANAARSVKLPYAKGQSFVVTQGYETPPTHIKKDNYALDFTQNGCDAYGKAVVAAASGTALFLSQEGYNGGYGTELIIDHGDKLVSRYAHMIPDSITIATSGASVSQGEVVGFVGDTGLVAGAACATHPGAHLHFAMDTVNADGTFFAYDAEPISGYTDITSGKWYLSDNGTTTPSASVQVLGLTDPARTSINATASPANIVFGSGVPAITAEMAVAPPDENNLTSTDDTATSTATSSVSGVPLNETLFQQPDDSANSPYSFYDDNWFDLGSGFSGTLNALTLEGMVSDEPYFASHIALQEFKDKDYTAMVQQFPISDNAPFTHVMATATFGGLSISLKPYFYYRLATIQDYQNRSVILAGTASTSVGIAMAHNFIYGTGGVETTSTFFPFIIMEGITATSTSIPPQLTTPGNITENFDAFNMQIDPSWSTSTDPDWPENPLHYQINYSTSSVLSDSGWVDPGSIPVATGNTYLIGIRAADDYGDVSAVATATWNFPIGFTPYAVSPELSYAYQYFTVPTTSTLSSITLYTKNFGTGARNPDGPWCTLTLFDEYDLSSVGEISADNLFNGYDCQGAPVFSFASSSFTLYPDHIYHWVFTAQTGNPSTGASVQFYGTAINTASGTFSDPSLVNAKFTVKSSAGILFSN